MPGINFKFGTQKNGNAGMRDRNQEKAHTYNMANES